nr:isoprenoid synthase domain-containing protein-like isoform X1 [Columba livia]
MFLRLVILINLYLYEILRVFFLVTDNLSQQVCVITDVKEAAAQVGFLLHESLKSQIRVESISVSLSNNDSHLQSVISGQCYNFVCINDKNHAVQETQQVVDMLEKSNIPLLYPVVLILVLLDISENISFSIGMEELSRIKKFAREVKNENILVYGLLIQYKGCVCGRSATCSWPPAELNAAAHQRIYRLSQQNRQQRIHRTYTLRETLQCAAAACEA